LDLEEALLTTEAGGSQMNTAERKHPQAGIDGVQALIAILDGVQALIAILILTIGGL